MIELFKTELHFHFKLVHKASNILILLDGKQLTACFLIVHEVKAALVIISNLF